MNTRAGFFAQFADAFGGLRMVVKWRWASLVMACRTESSRPALGIVPAFDMDGGDIHLRSRDHG